jgi:hypothetical protein
MNTVKYLVIAVIILCVTSVVGCGEKLDLSEVTDRAITATVEAQSYRATAVGTYTVDGETEESTYESEFVAPDRFYNKESSDGNWTEAISIGDESYIRSSEEPQWCQTPCQYDYDDRSHVVDVSPISLEKEIEPLYWLVDIEKLPDEEIDGVACLHYRGRVDQDAYVDMLQERAEREEGQVPDLEGMRHWMMDFELWVEKDSYLIWQLQGELRFTRIDPDTGQESLVIESITKRFYDFNQPIEIEPPV